MKKKRLYLHIGTHKTGSTTIQHWLRENSEKLKSEDYYYPMEGAYFYPPEASPSLLAHAVLGNKPAYLGQTVIDYDSCVADIKRDIEASTCSNIIISSEHFSNAFTYDAVKKVHDLFVDLFDSITVIIYLRRQDARIESSWAQAVKSSLSNLSFDDFYDQNLLNPKWDYFNLLKPWIDFFGEAAIKVRPFEKSQFLNGNLLHDFLSLIDLNIRPLVQDRRNISPSAEFLEVIRCFSCSNDLYKTKVHFNKLIYTLRVKIDQTKYTFMTPDQRKFILEKYRESNSNVARYYLKRSDGTLFLDSEISDLPVYPGLDLQRFSSISHQIIFGLLKTAGQNLNINQNK